MLFFAMLQIGRSRHPLTAASARWGKTPHMRESVLAPPPEYDFRHLCAAASHPGRATRLPRFRRAARWCLPSLADIFFLCPFLFLAFLNGNRLFNDGDTGYHIRAGDYILANLTIPHRDIFSYIDPPLPWIAHEWLSEVMMSVVHGAFGLTGVAIFFAVLIGLAYWMLFRVAQSGDSNVAVAALVVLLAMVSSTHWLARPHIFSLVLTIAWYGILDRYQRTGKDQLRWLPLLMLVWANLHGGFIIGLLLLGIYFGGNVGELLFSPHFKRAAAWRRSKRLALIGGGCLAAALCNPKGYGLLLFPFDIVSNRFVMDNVSEFFSPNFHHPLPYKYFLLFTIGLVSLSRKSLDAIETILLLLFVYMSLYSIRYIPLFAIIATPIVLRQLHAALQADSAVVRWLEGRGNNLRLLDAGAKGNLWPIVSVAVVCALAWNGKIEFHFDESLKPVAAVEFLKRENLPGKMFNDDEFGDYLIYAASPQYKVFFDGRSDMYGEQWGGPYTQIVRLRPDWENLVETHGFSWMFLPASAPLSVVLLRNNNWQLIYADPVAHIFLKKTAANADVIAKYPDVKVSKRTEG
jgi:hypothetical protein